MRISDWSSDVCSSDLFNFIAFNIACDAIINYVAGALPDVDKSAGSIRYGVRRCQEFGIVNWSKIVKEMQSLVATTGIALDTVFTRKPTELSCVDIDGKSVVKGKRWSVRVDHGGRRIIKKKKKK